MAGSTESNEDFSRHMSPRRHHRSPANLVPGDESIPAGSQRLDFHDVMARLRSMFPLDAEVIEAVLRANKGDVDAAVNDLLAMCTEEGIQPSRGVRGAPKSTRIKEMPPSYEQAVSMSGTKGGGNGDQQFSAIGGDVTRPQQPRMGAAAVAGATVGGTLQRITDDVVNTDLLTHSPRPLPGLPTREPRNSSTSSSSHHRYRIWKPPLLGALPDDFLRIVTLPSSSSSSSATPASASSTTGAMPANSATSLVPQSRRACSSCGRHHHHHSGRKESGELVVSHQCNNPNHHHHHQQQLPTIPQQAVAASGQQVVPVSGSHGHHNSVGRVGELLQKRLEANLEQQRRASQSTDIDPEVAQYLDDERIALMLQNEEFLRMLRHDEDFMRALKRDRLNSVQQQHQQTASGGSQASSRSMVQSRSELDGQTTGAPTTQRGDLAASLDVLPVDESAIAFPYTRDFAKEETDEDLRSQLKEMGGFSRKRFTALAKRFLSVRYKKKPPQLPFYKTELPTESTMNLLEDDETDQETRLARDLAERERRAREEIVEFEAWPSTVSNQQPRLQTLHNSGDVIPTSPSSVRQTEPF